MKIILYVLCFIVLRNFPGGLSLTANTFTDAMVKDIGKHCPKLEELTIHGSDLRKVSATSFPQTLHTFRIENSSFLGDWLQPLVGTDIAPKLRHLSFERSTRLDNRDLENVCKIFPHLKTLNVSYCYRVEHGLEKVAETLTELEELDISGTGFKPIGESPSYDLPRIFHKFCRNLTKLRVLKANHVLLVNDLGIATLASGVKSLEQLYLDGRNQLTDAALLHFAAVKKLRLLSIQDSASLSDEAIEKFAESCPNCVVRRTPKVVLPPQHDEIPLIL